MLTVESNVCVEDHNSSRTFNTNGLTIAGLELKGSRFNRNTTGWKSQTKSANYTMTIDDCGTTTFIDSSAGSVTVTLPATVAGYNFTFCAAATSSNAINISPNASDKIVGLNIGVSGGTDNKDYILASPVKGDLLTIIGDGVNGFMCFEARGTWSVEA